jgi:outer membrane protein assembly factor BamB
MLNPAGALPRCFFIAAALAFVLPAAHASADDWPVARGDQAGTAVAQSAVSDTPEVLWTYNPKDDGKADETAFEVTPVVAGGVVYLGDADGGFHAVRLKDGQKVWSVKFEDAGFVSAAAVRGEQLVVGDYNGKVRCLSTKDGAELWNYDAETEVYAGPTFHGDDVLVTTEGGVLVAINLQTGKEHWRFVIEAPLRCSPTIVEGRILLAGCDARLHAIDAASGKQVDSVEIGAATGNTAASRDGRAFFGNESGAFLAVDAPAPDAQDKLKIAWTFNDPRRGQGIRTTAAVGPTAVVFASQTKAVYALDPANGKELWPAPARTRSRVEASPVIAGGRVILATSRGRLLLLDLADGKEVWDYEVGGAFLAAPAVVDGKLLIANDDGTLYCFGNKE